MGTNKEIAQVDKFKEAAHQIEADESEGPFDASLKRVAKAKLPKEAVPSPATK